MKLAQQIALKIAAVVGGVVLLSAASIWGFIGLAGYFDASADQYERLRQIYEIGHHAATARRLIYAAEPDRATILEALSSAVAALPDDQGDHARIAEALHRAAGLVNSGGPLEQVAGQVNIALNQVTDLAQRIKSSIVANREAASNHLTILTLAMAALSLAVVIAAILLGRSQYRTMQRLVRAERLASVGYLAAGAAHEINNPLAIISGYAEAALRNMRTAPGGGGQTTLTPERALDVIIEQAFRCTAITSQLLTLASPGMGGRDAVTLEPLLKRCAEVISGLPQFQQRRIAVKVQPSDLAVQANEQELTQVVMNLLANAVDATDAQTGRITAEAAQQGRRVVIRFSDNGRGMSADVAARVFEPFYTDKPRQDAAISGGMGLGLAVSQAIVEQHGGRIWAQSDGEGRGATFFVELPVATEISSGGGGGGGDD